MARAAIVETCLDGPKLILAGRTGEELAKTGKICVARWIARRARGIEVITFTIRMPKLDQRATDRIAIAVQDPAAQVRDDAVGDRSIIIQLHQVVVLIQWDVVS